MLHTRVRNARHPDGTIHLLANQHSPVLNQSLIGI